MAEAPRPLLPLVGRDPGALREIRLVGRYALGVDWQDGHGSIYPFEVLRLECPCAACAEARGAGGPVPRGPAETWPAEIKRDPAGIRIRWQDGHDTTHEGRALRGLCRCALCTKAH
jgi:DUF971 family protein